LCGNEESDIEFHNVAYFLSIVNPGSKTMSEEAKELKKELARRKRIAIDIASEIHDIVEDSLWVDYDKMPGLSEKLVAAVQEANRFKVENGLS
jgi:hypothetical protein